MTDDEAEAVAAAPTNDEIDVTRDDARSRYVISVGGVPAGFSAYREEPGRVVFTHTVVKPAYEGQGLGSTLARYAIEDVVASGRAIVPECPFVRAYLERHHEYDDSVIAPDV